MRRLKNNIAALAAAAAASAICTTLASAGPAHGIGHQFGMMDANKDGKVSAEEHAAGAKAMFATMDANRDGVVSADEMTAAHKAVTGHASKKSDMPAHDKIKVVDANGDGKLTSAEHASAADMMFKKMDADQDGFLSKPEMAGGHAEMMKK